jgi:two-component system nitrogen regulation response regulator GlnG
MPTLLVVDDEPSVLYSFRRVFADNGVQVLTAESVSEGLHQFHVGAPDVVVLDLKLPDGSGLEVFEEIRATTPKLPVIFITAHGTTKTAIEAMKHGAFDYLVKPVDFDHVSEILQRAFQASHLMQVPTLVPALEAIDQIVGRSAVMQEMCKMIGRIASRDINVLILGESGVGKELVARAIYHHSRRSDRPFLAINCAALPEALVESELFGHELGAFTGATRRRIGKFEQCNGGTVLLDEIGDMPLPAQAKILRLLQEQRFERVGGTETVQAQVRVLAATNQDLERRIAEGRFRSDLYYRLKVVTITVPPLRERGGDMAELAHHFLFLFNRELRMNVEGFDPESLACLQQYRWPGNVRELQSVIKEAMLRSTGPLLLPEFLPDYLRARPGAVGESWVAELNDLNLMNIIEGALKRGENDLYAKVMRVVEQILFTRVIQETQGHQGQASDRLGLSRSTLRYKLRDLGLNVDRIVGEITTPRRGGEQERPLVSVAPADSDKQLSSEASPASNLAPPAEK